MFFPITTLVVLSLIEAVIVFVMTFKAYYGYRRASKFCYAVGTLQLVMALVIQWPIVVPPTLFVVLLMVAAAINWTIGYYCSHLQKKHWGAFERAEKRVNPANRRQFRRNLNGMSRL